MTMYRHIFFTAAFFFALALAPVTPAFARSKHANILSLRISLAHLFADAANATDARIWSTGSDTAPQAPASPTAISSTSEPAPAASSSAASVSSTTTSAPETTPAVPANDTSPAPAPRSSTVHQPHTTATQKPASKKLLSTHATAAATSTASSTAEATSTAAASAMGSFSGPAGAQEVNVYDLSSSIPPDMTRLLLEIALALGASGFVLMQERGLRTTFARVWG